MLDTQQIFEGLPLTIGAAHLEAVALPDVTLVAPYKGQMMAVADVLKAEIGMTLPPAGQCGESAKAMAYWRAPGQWLVFGALNAGKLAGMAAVADMSDAFGRLRLTGSADVLARLVELDTEEMQQGAVAHTVLADIPTTLIVVENGVEIVVPRSYAGSTVARLKLAIRGVAARERLNAGHG
ncbi:MAG: hypothetical protein COB08_006380 [Rhodobacteraceae bacterium]|nr:hypothetical protein [Paracoccaceae bacterium]